MDEESEVEESFFNELNTTILEVEDDVKNASLLGRSYRVNSICTNRAANTENNIRALVNELLINCPYEDEDLCPDRSPNDGLSCDQRSNDELTCDLKNKVNDIQNQFDPLEDRIQSLEEEVFSKILNCVFQNFFEFFIVSMF
ncbi:hypothetical protein PVAND_009348 [Polypedilum vanderplanki]|uniref:Uncharacterized protein n=1 Tax=Polypedilum vanderplanki TaxID=319348 RepID=A0A9J6CCM3_POLVA|nr:hypothetical protein PVAND_009348 [Polypedilum vanderplanki]